MPASDHPLYKREPPLRPDELRTLRAMMRDYRADQAVSTWINGKWRALAFIAGIASGVAVLAASIVELIKTAAGL